MEWESPWGVGFPGWHIECSAMSTKYLGHTFDIHTGGVDHIPVHHENEIAQTKGAYGVPQARVWMHSEFLTVDGGRMGKSLGNLYTLDDLAKKGFDPTSYRLLAHGTHYRHKLNFTFESLLAADATLRRLRETLRDWDAPGVAGCAGYEEEFMAALNDDLNTPQALSVLWKLVDDGTMPTRARARTLLKFDEVLGLHLSQTLGKPLEISQAVQQLVQARDASRAQKDWKESDRLREEIASHGFDVVDTPTGTKVQKGD